MDFEELDAKLSTARKIRQNLDGFLSGSGSAEGARKAREKKARKKAMREALEDISTFDIQQLEDEPLVTLEGDASEWLLKPEEFKITKKKVKSAKKKGVKKGDLNANLKFYNDCLKKFREKHPDIPYRKAQQIVKKNIDIKRRRCNTYKYAKNLEKTEQKKFIQQQKKIVQEDIKDILKAEVKSIKSELAKAKKEVTKAKREVMKLEKKLENAKAKVKNPPKRLTKKQKKKENEKIPFSKNPLIEMRVTEEEKRMLGLGAGVEELLKDYML